MKILLLLVLAVVTGCSTLRSKEDDPRCVEARRKQDSLGLITHCGMTVDEVATAQRLMENFFVKLAISQYQAYRDANLKEHPDRYPHIVVLAIEKGLPWRNDTMENMLRSADGREYFTFMKLQARRWRSGEIPWEEADYLITAKGNDLAKRFDKELARMAQRRELEKQTEALESLGRHRSAPVPQLAPSVHCQSMVMPGGLVTTNCQ